MDDPLPPDDLRCKRTDGRHWRCKRPIVAGKSFCQSHLHRSQKRTTTTPNPNPRIRIRVRVKPEPLDEPATQPPPAPLPDHLRCHRNDGRSWRCKNQAIEGQTLCETHFTKTKVQAQRKPRMRKEKKEENLQENIRCARNNGKDWRCKRQVIEGEKFCEVHLKKKTKVEKKKEEDVLENLKIRDLVVKEKQERPMRKKKKKKEEETQVVIKVENGNEKEKEKEKEEEEKEEAENVDQGRCKRTDGRGWRCKRRVCEGKTLCEIHYEQGRLRQMKITVPDSLKIQRGEGGEKAYKRLKRKRALETLESNSDKGMKRMKAELIRVFLRREIIERNKKTEKGSVNSGEVTRDLPYGLMAIPPAPTTQFLDNTGSLGIKVGVNCSNSLVTRRFRSKNIEPPPIGSVKVVPYAGNVEKVRSNGRRKCHWCRKSENLNLAKCSSCRKRYFCSNCIKERCMDPQEVELRCPVCCGSCNCKACWKALLKDAATKDILKEKCKGSKFQQLQYLINFLLPILTQINHEQNIEVEMEAKFKGQNPSEVEIRQADVGCRERCCCNNCKSPILDFHRTCPNCSYNLCLSCCQEYPQGRSPGVTENSSFKYLNRTNTLLSLPKKCLEKSAELASSAPLPDSTACLCISCPPMELGGCDNSLLHLSCIFPLNWTKELEMSAKEVASEDDFLQTRDDSGHCSLCTSITLAADRSKELQDASQRKESNDNFLYCPSTSDDHDGVLAHFQKHWQKGHPVKVRNVLQSASTLSWDPLAIFCGYLEKGSRNYKNTKDAIEVPSCSDSYEVEIGTKESFNGSLEEGYTHIRHETLKVKAKLPTAFTHRLLESRYNEIIHSLPLQEYTNPRTGLLNIAGKLPEDFPYSKLGPHLCISCGSREEVARGELVTKLCCNSYDVVNILVHVGDASCSMEQLNQIKKLIRRHNMKDDFRETRMHSEILVEAGDQQDRVLEGTVFSHVVAGASCCSAATNDASAVNLRDDKSSPAKLIHGSDTDSDASMICSGTRCSPDKSVDKISRLECLGSSNNLTDKRPPPDPCGAQWDVFRRQDIPKLVEYITKHVDELTFSYGLPNNVVHPIFDGSFYLDMTQKMQLKEEFGIEPWSFNQCLGEAVFIPAGCPYQMRNVKSCVNITLGFVSPENASECIKLMNEIRVLPNNHKAKQVKLEVEKMTICSIDEAIKEIYRLRSEEGSHPEIREI